MKKLKINLPFKTPSINHLHGRNNFGSVYLKTEAKILKKQIIDIVDEQKRAQGYLQHEWENRMLSVTTIISEKWFTKKDTIKKKDIANREKFLIDSVFESLGIDDSHIWEHRLLKHDDEKEYAVVKIEFFQN